MSPGEVLDRLTILRIKGERFRDEGKRATVRAEHEALDRIWSRSAGTNPGLDVLRRELQGVNERLWDVEDELRGCEVRQDFGGRFVELARSVYQLNDQRTALKRRVNEELGVRYGEDKQYGPQPKGGAG
jgi:hypothetical protein